MIDILKEGSNERLRTIWVEYEGQQIRFPGGLKHTKHWLRKWARMVWTNCGICGSEAHFDPEKGIGPCVCWECRFQLEQDAYDQGVLVGGRMLRRFFKSKCIHCGRTMQVTYRVKRVECERCKKVVYSTADPELKRRKLVYATRTLKRQYGLEAYQGPLDLIASRLMQPNWWDSSTEIVVTAEFLRMGYTAHPQKKIGDHMVDLIIPKLRMVVEIDGDLFHNTSEVRRRDRGFDAVALLEGYSVVRVLGSSVEKDVRIALEEAFKWAKRPCHYDLQWERAAWRYGGYETRITALRRTIRKILLRQRRFANERHAS